MSEVMNYNSIILGHVEISFIMFISHEPLTAYGVWSRLQQQHQLRKPAKNKAKSMSYKNVHKRFKRLHKIGLIQRVEGRFPRNAKPYKLTSRGLFEYLLLPFPSPPSSILDLYKEDIILQTILYQFFELETVGRFYSIQVILADFLRKCCHVILKTVESFRYNKALFDKWKIVVSQPKRQYSEDIMWYRLNDVIRDEAKNFVFKIISEAKCVNEHEREIVIQDEKDRFPIMELSRDKKFNELLTEIKIDFYEGCKAFYL